MEEEDSWSCVDERETERERRKEPETQPLGGHLAEESGEEEINRKEQKKVRIDNGRQKIVQNGRETKLWHH